MWSHWVHAQCSGFLSAFLFASISGEANTNDRAKKCNKVYIGTFPTNLSCKTMGKGSIKVGLIQQFHSSQWSNFQSKTSKIPDLSTCPLQVALLESRDPAKKKTRHIQARGKNNFAPPPSLFPRKKKKWCPPPPFSHAMAFTEAHVEFSVSN